MTIKYWISLETDRRGVAPMVLVLTLWLTAVMHKSQVSAVPIQIPTNDPTDIKIIPRIKRPRITGDPSILEYPLSSVIGCSFRAQRNIGTVT